MDNEAIREVVGRHLLTVLHAVDFDITGHTAQGGLDIAADEWSIHLEGDSGFLAIDDEPELPRDYAAARRRVMSERVDRALIAADRDLDGALFGALGASGDALTLAFVAELRSLPV